MLALLINGHLVSCSSEVSLDMVSTGSSVHIACVCDVCDVVVVSRLDGRRALRTMQEGEVWDCALQGDLTLTASPPMRRNASESKFLNAAISDLLEVTEGAPSLAKILGSAKWVPPHAEHLLATDHSVNVFAGGDGMCCVARRKAKPKYHRRCPKLKQRADIRTILTRTVRGEATWKQCGATFSTMMRYFQKSPTAFVWHTDDAKRTVIQCS